MAGPGEQRVAQTFPSGHIGAVKNSETTQPWVKFGFSIWGPEHIITEPMVEIREAKSP